MYLSSWMWISDVICWLGCLYFKKLWPGSWKCCLRLHIKNPRSQFFTIWTYAKPVKNLTFSTHTMNTRYCDHWHIQKNTDHREPIRLQDLLSIPSEEEYFLSHSSSTITWLDVDKSEKETYSMENLQWWRTTIFLWNMIWQQVFSFSCRPGVVL